MFLSASSFNGDISEWDVSGVTTMVGMYSQTISFNSDISKWDVSSVENMQTMFDGATAFTQQLCGPAWVHSKAIKTSMFEGTSGSILPTDCTITTPPKAFSPQSRAGLKAGVDAYLGSETRAPTAGSDHTTFVCKSVVCLDESCSPIRYSNDVTC